MHGLILLNKPPGFTCQQILNRIKKKIPKQKLGHVGTLDPFATGVLPIFLGSATKIIPYLPEDEKVYETTLKLGAQTDTLDLEGQILHTSPVPVLTRDKIQAVFELLQGEQLQTPPQYSAIKVQGIPLYRYARRGEEVELKLRKVSIHSLHLQNFDSTSIRFVARVGKGTYIRSLGLSIAEALGTLGYLTDLCRTQSGFFGLSETISLEQLDKILEKTETFRFFLLQNLNKILGPIFSSLEVSDPETIQRLLYGQTVPFDFAGFGRSESELREHLKPLFTKTPEKLLTLSQPIISSFNQKLYLKPLRILEIPLF